MTVARLGQTARGLLGAGVVLGVIVSPLFFSMFLLDPFEPAKAAALRWLAMGLVPVLGVRLVQRWLVPDPEPSGAPVWWFGLLAAFLAVLALSTVHSVVPAISLWGSTPRAFGAITMAALVVMGAAAAETGRRVWAPRVVSAVIVTSLPVMLYGLLQWHGQDPLPVEALRPASFLGNANWIGAWLVMVVPLTCASLVAQGLPPGGSRWRLASAWLLGALLAFQLISMAALRARGAMLATGVALFFLALFVAMLTRDRRLAYLLGSILVAITVVTAVVIALDVAAVTGDANSRGRVVIWDALVRLLRIDVARIPAGYGPDTLGLVVGRVYPEDAASLKLLTHYAFWDRAHSALLDGLATYGLAGTLLFLAITAAATGAGLKDLAILATRRDQLGALLVSVAGGVLGALAALLVSGSPGLAFPGFGTGLLGGLAIALLVRVCRATSEPARDIRSVSASQLMVSGLVAAMLGHFAELQAGFELVSSGAPFWIYAGLAIAGTRAWPAGSPRGGEVTIPPATLRSDVVQGLIIGCIVATAAVTLLMSTARSTDRRIIGVLGATWMFGVVFTAMPAAGGGRVVRRLSVMAWASLAGTGVSLVVVAYARQAQRVVDPLPFFVFLTASALVMAIVHGATGSAARECRVPWSAWLLLIGLSLVALWPAYRLAVVPMVADSSARLAKAWIDRRDLDRAIPLLRAAVRLAPWNDHYAGMLGGAYLDKAKVAVPPEPWLIRSEVVLLETIRRNPLLARYPLGLSALHVLWADLVPSDRSRHLAESERYALLALDTDPVRSRPEVETQIMAILLRRGVPRGTATHEARRVVRDAAPIRR